MFGTLCSKVVPTRCFFSSLLEDVEDMMRENLAISVSPPVLAHSQTAVFTIDFRYRDASAAAGVVQDVMSKIVESPYDWRAAPDPGSYEGLRARIAALQARIETLERRLNMPLDTLPPATTAEEGGHIRSMVLDPPRVPESPIFPNRAMFAGSGLAFGVGAGGLLGVARRLRRPAAPIITS